MTSRTLGVKRMTPVELQEPPRAEEASHNVRIAFVATFRVFSLPSAKKPMLVLSGDQKGKYPPWAPGKMRSAPVRREWYQRSSAAPKMTAVPSGERTGGAPRSPSIWNGRPELETMEE